jgi:type II secretory pathway pseudopilin PulG
MAPRRTDHQLDIDRDQRDGRRGRADRGYTLIEQLIGIALMGTIVMAIMGGMWAVVRVSVMNDERAKVQAIIGGAGDRLTNYAHVKCPEQDTLNTYLNEVRAAADTVGWPHSTVEITDYRYFHPDTGTWEDTYSWQSSDCTTNPVFLTREKTIQKITITVTAPNGGYSQSIDIVKADIRPEEVRDVTAPNP